MTAAYILAAFWAGAALGFLACALVTVARR